jgi:drug/metabolite transporter (DMT)-like permease
MDVTRKNHRIWMITIYLFLMAGFIYLKPSVAFGREGRIRPFGASDRESTVFPVWWWVFVLAVVSYCITLYLAGFRFTS